jgi:hypothetical protein
MLDSLSLRWLPAAVCLASVIAMAQQSAPPGADLADFAAKRFPQPVRVGDLIHRRVLQPLESRPVLGRVDSVVRQSDGKIAIIVDYGGLWGLGGRLIAVPAEAMVLLGDEMEILDFAPRELDQFPAFRGGTSVAIPANARILVGLAHPSH